MTEMEEYFTQIYDGKIVACKKMRKISEILLDQLYMPNEYHGKETYGVYRTFLLCSSRQYR